jgi:hypothetical protein
VNIVNTVRISFAEDIMIEAHRFSRQARGDRRATDSVADHRLLDERGRCLGSISETAELPLFGPLEPTVYLDRSRAPTGAPRIPDSRDADTDQTSAHLKEGVK